MTKSKPRSKAIKPDAAYLAKVAASTPKVPAGNTGGVASRYFRVQVAHATVKSDHWEFKRRRSK